MAALKISSAKQQRTYRGLATALASAVLEWLLISLLFANSIFSYLITKFARYCKLQTPCLLCSRLDHVFGNEKLGYYRDLICGNHKLEISSLVLCHAHDKLVDVHGMCENCLFSFATVNKSNSETYRLLVGKLGEDSHSGFDQDPLLEGHKIGCSSTKHCSCCNEPWVLGGYTHRLNQSKSIGSEAAELDVPLSGVVGLNQDDLRMRREEPSVSAPHMRNYVLDPLSRVGYTELNVTSDTESEVLYSDDDNKKALLHETDDFKDDLTAQASSSVSQVQLDSIEPHGSTSVAPTVSIMNDLEELNWQQADSKVESPAPTVPISPDDFPPSSNAVETTIEVSKESLDLTRTDEVEQTPVAESGKIFDARTTPITSSEIVLETKPVSTDAAQQLPYLLDLGDAYKIAVGNRGRQFSGVLVEQRMGKDSSRISEDFKNLLSQLSATRGLEQSTNEKSPRFSVNSDELKTSDALNSIGMQILHKRISLEQNEPGLSLDGSALQRRNSIERNESGLSLDGSTLQKRISLERNESELSLDGSNVSEIEGESLVDRLKRQIDHDRKHVSALYKELEEERNASAIAVNQSMAMITKLQEEKATIHMEALQCLRLLEEQSEYDMEALQKANDLLAEKEKEIQDLESELEFYRNKFPSESTWENVEEETNEIKARDIEMDQTESIGVEDSASSLRDSVSGKPTTCDKVEGTGMPLGDKDTGTMKNTDLQFEDERSDILKSLKKLEKKLYLLSNNGVYLSNGEYARSEGDGKSEFKESNSIGGNKENGRIEENGLTMQDDVSVSCSDLHAQSSFEKAQLVCKENSEFDSSGQGSPVLVSLGNEVLDLNGRLEALEADRTFLEHTIKSLGNGEEGLRLIREVASHLQELRRIGIRRIDRTVA
ncbi:myosin-binding protein 1-like isoform X3 [Castanea sativa]|uniref:myosin-binding protein 1-like isoform X3 n=1 Tax=Castanea sativa TaxID=21020 RepID=UPI003F64BB2B